MPNESIPTFDLYAELGLPISADHDEIESAFRTLAMRHHPDTAADTDRATARMKRLNLARTWLLDPVRRARYDDARGVRHGPEVVLPRIDPLGAWPDGTPGYSGRYAGRRQAAPNQFWNALATIALMVLITTVVFGSGSFLAAAAALLSVVILLFVGLLWILGRFMPTRHE